MVLDLEVKIPGCYTPLSSLTYNVSIVFWNKNSSQSFLNSNL